MSAVRKALFIDRDGTINRDCPYCHNVEDLVIYEDTVELMRTYQDKGYLVLIVTNQSGINRGYFSASQFNAFMGALIIRLRERGVHVNGVYFCPHRPDEGCKCRKPGTEMIELAASDFRVNLEESLVVGDREDVEGVMARRLGIPYRILDN